MIDSSGLQAAPTSVAGELAAVGKSSCDRAAGVLLGLAAGDRIGGPLCMAVRLAESLATKEAFSPDDILARYVQWHREGAFDTGPVSGMVLARIAAGMSSQEAARLVHNELDGITAGCNPAHRCGPLAMAGFLDDASLAEAACREAALTHYDPVAGDVAAAVVVLCRRLIRGSDWRESLADAVAGRMEVTRRALAVINRAELNKGGYAPDVLAAAIHFLDSHDGFEDALSASIRFAGPANYCPVLVGAIGGARWGYAAVPSEWIAHHREHHRLIEVTKELSSSWRNSCTPSTPSLHEPSDARKPKNGLSGIR